MQTQLTQRASLSYPNSFYFNLSPVSSKWCLPLTRQMKLNVDDCVRLENDKAGIGGVFKNSKGDWQLGFYGRIRGCSSLESEIRSIYRGITIAYNERWINLEIESDGLEAVLIFQGERDGPNSMKVQVKDGKMLLNQIVSRISHVGRDANEVANSLANMGGEQIDSLVMVHETPEAVKGLMITDKLGIGMFI